MSATMDFENWPNGRDVWTRRPLAGFDVETTGLQIGTDRLVTACVARGDGGAPIREWLANPRIPISAAAMDVHGVTDEVAAGGRLLEDVAAEVSEELYACWDEGYVVAVYRGSFDFGILATANPKFEIRGPVVDAFVVERRAGRGMRSRSAQSDLEVGTVPGRKAVVTLDRQAQVSASRKPVVRREHGQQVVEERLEAHRSARAKIPGDSRRRAVMASGYPCDARVKGIEQRRFPLPFRFLDAHTERRAHHEPLELRLHDPVRAARTRQAQLVATLCAHALPARFISSTTRPVGIITGEYKVRGGRQPDRSVAQDVDESSLKTVEGAESLFTPSDVLVNDTIKTINASVTGCRRRWSRPPCLGWREDSARRGRCRL